MALGNERKHVQQSMQKKVGALQTKLPLTARRVCAGAVVGGGTVQLSASDPFAGWWQAIGSSLALAAGHGSANYRQKLRDHNRRAKQKCHRCTQQNHRGQ